MKSRPSNTRVLIFRSTSISIPQTEEEESQAIQASAEILKSACALSGFTLANESSVQGEGQVYFKACYQDVQYSVQLGVFAIGANGQECWAVAFVPIQSGLLSLRNPVQPIPEDAILAQLSSAVAISFHEWLSEHEFAERL